MTIVPFLRDIVFEPHDIQAMSKALEDVCQILNISDQAESEKEVLARKIIAFAHQGPRDPTFLRDRTLREIVSNQGAWPPALVRKAQWGSLTF
jgi:ABC-type hemin transport system substrate-binding protein